VLRRCQRGRAGAARDRPGLGSPSGRPISTGYALRARVAAGTVAPRAPRRSARRRCSSELCAHSAQLTLCACSANVTAAAAASASRLRRRPLRCSAQSSAARGSVVCSQMLGCSATTSPHFLQRASRCAHGTLPSQHGESPQDRPIRFVDGRADARQAYIGSREAAARRQGIHLPKPLRAL
jgi:hypothetical protein